MSEDKFYCDIYVLLFREKVLCPQYLVKHNVTSTLLSNLLAIRWKTFMGKQRPNQNFFKKTASFKSQFKTCHPMTISCQKAFE